MLDILVDQFGTSVDAPEYKTTVTAAIGPALGSAIVFADDAAMHAELNTFFHVDRKIAAVESWDRGVVIAAVPPIDEDALGFNPVEMVASEFLFAIDQIPRQRRAQAPADLELLQQPGGVVLVEMGADCDHAQNQDRTRRFLVGLEIPEDLIYLARLGSDRKLRNGALELLGPWKIDGTVKYLIVSCRRYWTWQRRTPPPADPRYRLRASLVDKLLHRYSSWSSRPGIIEFR